MKDMPEFYDHVEEEIESEMKQLNKEWIRTKLPWGCRNKICDVTTGQMAKPTYAEYRIVDNRVEYRVHYEVKE